MADSDAISWLSKGVHNIKIDNAAASGDYTVLTVTPGTRFCIYHLWLQAEGVVDVIVKAGSTQLTGPIAFAANAEKEFTNAPIPVFVGTAAGNNFVLNLSVAVQVNGFALYSEMTA